MIARSARGLGTVLLVALWLTALASLLAWAEARAQPALEPPRDRSALDGPARSEADASHAAQVSIVGGLERALLAHVTLDAASGRVAGHCRSAPGGCAARIRRIAVAIAHESALAGVDPWLVAAQATIESGLNSDALGRAGELGLLQLHPRGAAARRALAACARETDRRRCGVHLVREGVRLLASAIARHGLEGGLAAYNAGRADSERGRAYARRVLRRRDELRARVER